jgi:hypothetical protein
MLKGMTDMSEPPARYSAARVVARFVSRLVHHTVRSKGLIFLASVLGVIWLINPTALFGSVPSAAPATDSAEQYLQALRDRDATVLVSALAPQARQALEVRFGTTGVTAAAAMFREQESQGMRVVGWERIGSYNTVQGDELRFYVVHFQRGDERRDVSYVLTLDAEGKVARIE